MKKLNRWQKTGIVFALINLVALFCVVIGLLDLDGADFPVTFFVIGIILFVGGSARKRKDKQL